MVSAALVGGTSFWAGTTGTIKEWSFWVDGVDLVDYLDPMSVNIQMESSPTENSRASFRLINKNGTLDFNDFWGWRAGGSAFSAFAFPLREVRLYDHVRSDIVFGGYVTAISMTPYYPGRSYIELQCVGYSVLLDASVTTYELFVPINTDSASAIQACVQAAGLRGGAWANTCAPGDWSAFSTTAGQGGIDGDIGTIRWDITVPINTTLRQAIVQVCGGTSRAIALYIDNWKRLCVVSANGAAQAETAPATNIGPDLSTDDPGSLPTLTVDFSEYANRVLLTGANLPIPAGMWFEGRMTSDFPNEGAQQYSTYAPSFDVDIVESTDVDDVYMEDVAFARLGTRQAGAVPAFTFTVRGYSGWRLLQFITVKWPQFMSATTALIMWVTSYTIRIQPTDVSHDLEYEVTVNAQAETQAFVGGFATAISPNGTTAQYMKQRLEQRTG